MEGEGLLVGRIKKIRKRGGIGSPGPSSFRAKAQGGELCLTEFANFLQRFGWRGGDPQQAHEEKGGRG